MHVLSSWDIMVAHEVFCQNLCLWLFIGQKNVLQLLWWSKTQERHAVTAIFLHLPWFSLYLQHCPKTENWLMIKRYHWVLQRGWNNWVLPSRYGVLLTFLRLNITRITLWNNFSGLCIKFRNETWRQIRYLGQNITNLQNSTFDANVTPGMRKKDILYVLGHKLSFRTLVQAKNLESMYFQARKPLKCHCHLGTQGSQNLMNGKVKTTF